MNIRNVGDYEIVICDENKKRLKEFVVKDVGLIKSIEKAEQLKIEIQEATNFYINRVVYNSLYNVHNKE